VKNQLQIGKKYRHFKGGEYKVIGLSHHSETLEPYVVYQALYYSEGFGENSLWIRPLQMFLETVTVDGVVKERFTCIE